MQAKLSSVSVICHRCTKATVLRAVVCSTMTIETSPVSLHEPTDSPKYLNVNKYKLKAGLTELLNVAVVVMNAAAVAVVWGVNNWNQYSY